MSLHSVQFPSLQFHKSAPCLAEKYICKGELLVADVVTGPFPFPAFHLFDLHLISKPLRLLSSLSKQTLLSEIRKAYPSS